MLKAPCKAILSNLAGFHRPPATSSKSSSGSPVMDSYPAASMFGLMNWWSRSQSLASDQTLKNACQFYQRFIVVNLHDLGFVHNDPHSSEPAVVMMMSLPPHGLANKLMGGYLFVSSAGRSFAQQALKFIYKLHNNGCEY
jgi:hypothetical protein